MKKNTENSSRYSLPFWIVLIAFSIISLIIPLRPERSYSEKRALAKFPDFSWDTLASGQYFDDITLWFSDTFPGRQTFVDLSAKINSLHGTHDIAFTGSDFHADEVPVVPKVQEAKEESSVTKEAESSVPDEKTESADSTGDIDRSESDTDQENADSAAKSPELSESADIASSEETESTASEESQEPEMIIVDAPEGDIQTWGGIDAGDAADIILGNVIQIGDSAFSYFGFSEYYSSEYAHLVGDLADELADDGVRVICAPVPQAVGIMVEPEYQEKLYCSEQNAVLEYIGSELGDNAIMVNMYPNLVAHNDEYLYFRTDHHWCALGAYHGYESICQALGETPVPLEDFTERDMGEFIGSIYWSAPDPYSLQTDDVIAYDPPGDISFKISDDGYSFWDWDLITDLSGSDVYSKYMTFIAGDHALSLAVNDSIPDGKTCVVIKDSCGNPMVPFLTQLYHKVYVLDFRDYTNMCLSTFAEEYDVDDIIFCHMLGMVQGDGPLSIFRWLIQ